MTGIERIETFRRWRSLVRLNPAAYRLRIHKTGTVLYVHLEEYEGFFGRAKFWKLLEYLPAWDIENPPQLTKPMQAHWSATCPAPGFEHPSCRCEVIPTGGPTMAGHKSGCPEFAKALKLSRPRKYKR